MRRKADAIDRLLEDWARWKFMMATMEYSTGDCHLLRFGKPTKENNIPLWLGPQSGQSTLALNHDLQEKLEPEHIIQLIVIYGSAGPIDKKAKTMDVTVSHLQSLIWTARSIAIFHNRGKEVTDRDPLWNRRKESEHPARPLPPEPAAD